MREITPERIARARAVAIEQCDGNEEEAERCLALAVMLYERGLAERWVRWGRPLTPVDYINGTEADARWN